eukprot:TRINITY_DN12234_c0_g1_i1.p1 TRINITY_DN12234_c0_g1~~TRINITY_DN12234_c0_g1_i1.p1  ORF type:complete len:611 (+),score=161.97 TRINITY_DN12234_c0_g1_i1:57-1889(+)
MASVAELPREKFIQVLVKLLSQKDEVWAMEVDRKSRNGESLSVKGHAIGPDVLKEALERYRKERPALSSSSQIVASTSTLEELKKRQAERAASQTTASGTGALRFNPGLSSADAMAAKASLECEDSEQFQGQVSILGSNKVAVMRKPDVSNDVSGEYLLPDEAYEVVARSLNRKDGRVYLRLRKFTGWVSTRSRKDISKVVLGPAPGTPTLEPPSVAHTMRPRAARMLQAMNEDGKVITQAPAGTGADAILAAGASGGDPKRFRATIASNILSRPDIAGNYSTVGARINGKEEFLADGVFVRPADGRAYLHLQDGRGWVCERSKSDFTRLAVEPADRTESIDDDMYLEAAAPPQRRGGGGTKKVLVVERKDDSLAAADPAARIARGVEPGGGSVPALSGKLVLRSDLEIWPQALRPPKPLTADLRYQMRRIFRNFGNKTRECEEDLAEIQEKVDGYGRACPAQKELQQYADTLKKEMQKMQKEWAEEVKKKLGDELSKLEKQVEKAITGSSAGGIVPVQVRGARWFCASLGGSSDADGDPTSKALGPLRSSEKEAQLDLTKMQEAERAPKPLDNDVTAAEAQTTSKRKAKDAGDNEEEPKAKRGRGAAKK